MLNARDRAIIEALSEGLTDAEVAERISVSPRTVAYAVRSLMDRYRVENRFQLGLVLGAGAEAPIPGTEEPGTAPA